MTAIFPVLLVGGGIFALIRLFADSGKPGKAAADLPDAVKDDLRKYQKTGDVSHLKNASVKAAKSGNTKAAKAIKRVHDSVKVTRQVVTYKSPIAGITGNAWTKFVNGSQGPNVVSADFHIGIFQFGARRLTDLKVMRAPKQVTAKTEKKVWSGTWITPQSLTRFIGDATAQYKLFAASCLNYAKRIAADANWRKFLGAEIDGHKVTLSGLLAIAHKAGFSGGLQWLKSAKDRSKFVSTSAAFKRLNGLF